ncbi:hypothetical protein NX784_02425 [Massilia pinisoli]|uniref:Uncharacterized protein n=1 Tax=Massilia pinisoli TaxID=1772194 RepID=A0ABT1ZKI8_9BURK|nr:hypothetical protein [Massilia pinisoli]MCS0580435.1 hypothetical protein [Massilia pinisoli]
MLVVRDTAVFQEVQACDMTCNEGMQRFSSHRTVNAARSSRSDSRLRLRALALPYREINKSEIGCLFTKHFLGECIAEFTAESSAELSGGAKALKLIAGVE